MPTIDQQRDALRKGLGRAVAWAGEGRLDHEALLDACLHDQRYDAQCEDNRGDWLWPLIQRSSNQSLFREPLLNALRTVTAEHDARQLCELGYHYAASGDAAFGDQLWELVSRRQIVDEPLVGEGQLLSLRGEAALGLIARLRGEALAIRDWEWDDKAIVDHAIEVLGQEVVHRFLSDAAEPAIQRFAAAWRLSLVVTPTADPSPPTYLEKLQSIPIEEIFDDIRLGIPGRLGGWGMQAGEADLEAVLSRLWSAADPQAITGFLRVFSNRTLPRFDPRLIEFCRHEDLDVRRMGLRVLEMNSHPTIREIALRELGDDRLAWPATCLLVRNFEPGDEQRIIDQAELPQDPAQQHAMLADAIHLLEANEQADASKLGQIAYFHTPCGICRSAAAELLRDRQVAPDWLMNECREDSNEDSRTIFESTADDVEE